jgi:hypothetical protein
MDAVEKRKVAVLGIDGFLNNNVMQYDLAVVERAARPGTR